MDENKNRTQGFLQMVSDNKIAQINGIPVADVAKALGIKVLRGNKAMCFAGHDDKTASLSFNVNKNYWKCFGCNSGGNNINLVQKVNNYTFKQALDWLSHNFLSSNISIRLRRQNIASQSSKQRNVLTQECGCKPDTEVYEWIIENSSLSQKGLDYLHRRGFTDNTIEHFKIKDLAEPKVFLNKLVKNLGTPRLQKCGLLSNDKHIAPYWDYSLWFPFFENKRIVYLQRRRFADDGPKYVNLSNISKPYYNVDILLRLKANDIVYICEGIPDTIMAHQIKWNAIGVLGATSINAALAEILSPYNVFIIPDMDVAGTKFYQKARDLFLQQRKIVERLYLKDAKDFCDYVNKERSR